jgi:hypothetical protein
LHLVKKNINFRKLDKIKKEVVSIKMEKMTSQGQPPPMRAGGATGGTFD